MQGTAWIALFRRIPTTEHDCLVLMTSTGAEIVLQRILRLDRDFLVCQGRLAGSTDQGKLLIIPYDQMMFLAFSKKMSDAEIQTALGKPGVEVELVGTGTAVVAEPIEKVAAELTGLALEPAAGSLAETPQLATATEPTKEAAKPAPKVAAPSKSILLARLRQRLANDMAKQPGAQ